MPRTRVRRSGFRVIAVDRPGYISEWTQPGLAASLGEAQAYASAFMRANRPQPAASFVVGRAEPYVLIERVYASGDHESILKWTGGSGRWEPIEPYHNPAIGRAPRRNVRRRRSNPAGAASPVPGIAKWGYHAGGTGAAPGKHSYTWNMGGSRRGETEYFVDPVSTRHGRHAGYRLTAFGGTGRPGWFDIGPDGSEDTMAYAGASPRLFASPQAAVAAARKHAALHTRR